MADVGDEGQLDPIGQLLDQSVRLIAAHQLELESKGYPSPLVHMAIERARGTAEYKSLPLSSAIRLQGFHDILQYELRKAESWITAQAAFLEGTTSPIVSEPED